MNIELDKAFRLDDFITMGQLIAYDALNREESCGGHFREEHQTEEGEAKLYFIRNHWFTKQSKYRLVTTRVKFLKFN